MLDDVTCSTFDHLSLSLKLVQYFHYISKEQIIIKSINKSVKIIKLIFLY